MRDLASAKLIYLKAALLLAIGTVSAAQLLLAHPAVETAALLVLAIWAFARAYYFAFYVIEKYVDPSFRFSGLFSVAKYLLSRR
jgi:hypothetical protein